jgi:hypothetical protein
MVGFGDAGVWVGLSNWCSLLLSGFRAPTFVLASFGYSAGWHVDQHIRVLADVNRDQILDIVGFGPGAVWVSTGTGGGNFADPFVSLVDLAPDEGWYLPQNPRAVMDLNADGFPDLVGFGTSAVYRSMNQVGTFIAPQAVLFDPLANGDFRLLGDVNGDHLVDLVSIDATHDAVALSEAQGPQLCPAAAGVCSSFSGATDVRYYDTLVGAGVTGCTTPATLCTGESGRLEANTIFYSACPNSTDPSSPLRNIQGLLSDTDPSFDGELPVIADAYSGSCLPPPPAGSVYVFWTYSVGGDPKHMKHPRCPSACLCPADICSGSGTDI